MSIKKLLVTTSYKSEVDGLSVYIPEVLITWTVIGSAKISSARTNDIGQWEYELDAEAGTYLFSAIFPEGYDLPVSVTIDLESQTVSPIPIKLEWQGNPKVELPPPSRNIRIETTYVDHNESEEGEESTIVKVLPNATIKYCYPSDNEDNFIIIGQTNSQGILVYSFPTVELTGNYKFIAEYKNGYNDVVSKEINLYENDNNPVIIELQWSSAPTKIVDPELEVLPYPEPSWIYEGTNPDYYEYGTGIVLNRAPKEIQENVESLLKFIKNRVEYLDLINVESWDSLKEYSKWDIVKDDYGVAYIYMYDIPSTGNPLTDTTYWEKVELAGTGAVLDIDGGFI